MGLDKRNSWTPGPWQYVPDADYIEADYEFRAADGTTVAAAVSTGYGGECSVDVSDANAELICLAPDMAEVIDEASRLLECFCDRSGECVVCKLDAMAAKLRGIPHAAD